jgi:hypothetical protein
MRMAAAAAALAGACGGCGSRSVQPLGGGWERVGVVSGIPEAGDHQTLLCRHHGRLNVVVAYAPYTYRFIAPDTVMWGSFSNRGLWIATGDHEPLLVSAGMDGNKKVPQTDEIELGGGQGTRPVADLVAEAARQPVLTKHYRPPHDVNFIGGGWVTMIVPYGESGETRSLLYRHSRSVNVLVDPSLYDCRFIAPDTVLWADDGDGGLWIATGDHEPLLLKATGAGGAGGLRGACTRPLAPGYEIDLGALGKRRVGDLAELAAKQPVMTSDYKPAKRATAPPTTLPG